ncbi:MAG: hydroxymethylbilane synthase [Chloroflexi bacterium]|nr:hydroxymethylbilane synthase [Chloroflexota bacterium]
MNRPLVLGSRGSLLALTQTQEVLEGLQALYPRREFSIRKIETRGDILRDVPLSRIGGKGVFVKEVQEALRRGEVDMAVHSFKDLPTEPNPGITVACITRRLDPRDALVSREGLSLDGLPPGARVGTSSPRRSAQLKAFRPDLALVEMRGNMDTRLRKVASGMVETAVVAAAGLLRLGWGDRISQFIPPEICLPSVGQGALAVEMREGDAELAEMLAALDHPPTRLAITAERAFLEALGGGCHYPIAALGEMAGQRLLLQGLVASPTGERVLRDKAEGENPEATGRALAQKLLEQGAGEILKEVAL